ncbi:MAG: YheU family protein [Steroidobacteraceae bacterium]
MNEDRHSAVVVPHTELKAELLRSIIESFVLREGTDYGEREFSLEDKVRRVKRQIERGEAQILYDPQTESVDIVGIASASRRG